MVVIVIWFMVSSSSSYGNFWVSRKKWNEKDNQLLSQESNKVKYDITIFESNM